MVKDKVNERVLLFKSESGFFSSFNAEKYKKSRTSTSTNVAMDYLTHANLHPIRDQYQLLRHLALTEL
jgi:hypothetical protein